MSSIWNIYLGRITLWAGLSDFTGFVAMASVVSRYNSTSPAPTSGIHTPGPAPLKEGFGWLFETKGRAAPSHGFGLYLMISAVGVLGFVGLLILASLLPGLASVLRPAALAWFVLFGLCRISMFFRK